MNKKTYKRSDGPLVLGIVLLFITAFVWGIAFAFQRSGMEDIGPLTFMAARCVFAAIFIGLLLLVLRGKKEAFSFDKVTWTAGIIGGVILTIANNLQQIGLVYTSAGKAGFITALYIVLVPVINWLFLKKRPSIKVWFAVLISATGLFLLCIKEDFSITKGDLWVMACAVFFSVHIIAMDYFVAYSDPIKVCFISFLISAILGWICAFIFEEPAVTDLWNARAGILYCGVVSAGIGYTFQLLGQKYVEASTASLIMSLESVFAALGGWLLLNEQMSARELAGAGLMFFSVLLVQIKFDKLRLIN